MNTIGTIGIYPQKPNAYHIGKNHEDWAWGLINQAPESGIAKTWLRSLYESYEQVNSIKPETHTEKSDFFISAKTRQANGMKKVCLSGVSAKCGTTSMPGQLFRASISNVGAMNFIPTHGRLYEQHKSWLSERQDMSEIKDLDTSLWQEWYQNRWDYIKESALFGNKTHASSLLMSNLDYIDNQLVVRETVMVDKHQVLKDMEFLSHASQVFINLNHRGRIDCGIITIQRAGGSNGEKGAEDWQARINRNAYIKWIKQVRPQSVWSAQDTQMH